MQLTPLAELQGPIDSPWYFILAAEMLFRTADNGDGHGIDLELPGGNLIRLEYADDAALICSSTEEASSRLTKISVEENRRREKVYRVEEPAR